MQAWIQECLSAGKSEGAGQREREQAKRTKSERRKHGKGEKAVYIMEVPVRVCRLIQSASHYVRRKKA